MCRGCGVRHNSVQDGIPAQIQNVNRQAQLGTLPIAMGLQSPVKFEPIRGFAMKEFEEQMGMLKKENFSLKLRIYFLEEQMGKKDFSPESNADIYNALELKAEAEALKDELRGKEELLAQASEALFDLEKQYQNQVDHITNNNEREKHQLKEQIQELQNEVDEFWSHSTQEERSESVEPELMKLCHSDSIGGLSDLCDLAFNTTSEDEPDNAKFSLPHTIQENATINPFDNPAPLQGLFSILENLDNQNHNTLLQQDMPVHQNARIEKNLSGKVESTEATVRVLERQVAMLETQVMELEEELTGKEDRSFILEGDLVNLRKELEDKTEEVVGLQVEILDKDMQMQNISEELHSSNKMIEDKEQQIYKLCEDLHNVEPEMEVTIQKIVERDRIIEGKIEQIEAQNKIIVEIQITLDEKQKQISELECNLMHTQQQLSSVTDELENQTEDNKSVIAELQAKEHEVVQLKNNLKKQESNVHRLVAELKESMDMLNKVQWEAQNCTSDDSITEMAEEENERLWAELEQTKMEIAKLQSDHEQTMAIAQNTINELQNTLQEQCNKLQIIKDEHAREMKECEDSLKQKTKELIQYENEVLHLKNDISNRDVELQNNINHIVCLNNQLSEAKEKLHATMCELDKLKNEIKSCTKCNSVTEHILPVVNKDHINVYNYASEGISDNHSTQSNNIYATRNTNEIKENPLLLKNQSNNAIKENPLLLKNQSNNAILIQNGTTSLTVNSSPVTISTTNDNSQLFTILYSEINDIRKEAQSLRCERKALSEKVLDLHNLMKQHSHVGNEIKYHKTENEVKDGISEENKQKLDEITLATSSQLMKLNQELENVKQRINCQFKEVHIHSNQEVIANYQEENSALREQLTASNEKCELLRTNLEDMSICLHEVVSPKAQNTEYNHMSVRNILYDHEAYTHSEPRIGGNHYKTNANDEVVNDTSLFGKKGKMSYTNKTHLSELKRIKTSHSMPCVNTTVEMESLENIHTSSESTVPNQSINNLQKYQYTSHVEDGDTSIQDVYKCNNYNSTETSINTSDYIILTPLLKDINSLCQKLEEATNKNDILKEQLQTALMSQYNNNCMNPEFIPEYQATVEELSETKRQLEESQALLIETTQQAEILQQQRQVNLSHTEAMEAELNEMYNTIEDKNATLEEKDILLQEAKQVLEQQQQVNLSHTEAMEVELNEMYKTIEEKNAVLEEKDILLQEAQQILEEKETLLHETSIQISANNEVIQGLSDEIEYLQKVVCEKNDLEEQMSVVQYSLQACESRLLQVNKERLAQVTERKHQQAQISALSLQIHALEEEQSINKEIIEKYAVLTKQIEEEKSTVSTLLQEKENLMANTSILEEEIARGKQTLEENAVLVKQLENERETMALIQQENKNLLSVKLKLQKDMQDIQNELASIDACAYHIQTQHSHNLQQYHIQQHNYQILREKHMKLQQTHSELQMKAEQLEDDLLLQTKKQQQLEINQKQIENFETHIKQLNTQVETERQLTSNLRQQLEAIRPQSSTSILHNANKTCDSPPQHSEEISHSEHCAPDASEINQKASCLSQKGTRSKKRRVHWSDENNSNQKEENDCCTENTDYTLETETKSLQRKKSDSEPEMGTKSKFSLHEHDMKQSSETSLTTISSCSSSVRKKNKITQFPKFISNGQYG